MNRLPVIVPPEVKELIRDQVRYIARHCSENSPANRTAGRKMGISLLSGTSPDRRRSQSAMRNINLQEDQPTI